MARNSVKINSEVNVDSAKVKKSKDKIVQVFGSSGEVSSSFAVDPEWDSVEGVDVRSLI